MVCHPFKMAASLNLTDKNISASAQRLLCLTVAFMSAFNLVGTCAEEDGEQEGHLLCRNCGHEVAKASDLISIPSHHAFFQRNETILGVEDVLIQYFRNPAGMNFELITTSSADVDTSSKEYPADTWFDNFTWKIAKCQRCYVHLGWCYEPGENLKAKCHDCEDTNRAITEALRFYGLILDKIIHEHYADSLVMSPKFYGG